jgi:hypothetical protein
MGDGVLVAERPTTWSRTQRSGAIAWFAAVGSGLIWLVIAWQLAFPAPDRIRLGWHVGTLGFLAVGLLSMLFSVVGAVIVARRPSNAVGWLNVVASVFLAVSSLGLMAGSQLLGQPNPSPAVQLVAFFCAAALQASVAAFGLVFLWFPDGPRAAGRFRWLAALIPIAMLIRFLELFFQKGPDWLLPLAPIGAPGNPYEIGGLGGQLWDLDHAIGVGWWLSGTCIVLAAVSLALRFRRSKDVERRQLLWFTTAVALVTPTSIAFVYVLLALPPATADADAIIGLFYLGLALPAMATLVAITRYRLYEIDRIVNRAIVYGAVTTILAAMFAGLITISERAFALVAGSSADASIVLTSVLITAAYTPVRAWVERRVDRRVRFADPRFGEYRESLINALETFDPTRAAGRLVREAVGQLHATAGTALLELDGELRAVATAGEWQGAAVALVVPIGAGRNRIGELRLAARDGGQPYGSRDVEALTSVADLAAQAIIAAERAALPTHAERLDVGVTGPPSLGGLIAGPNADATSSGAGDPREDPDAGQDAGDRGENDEQRQET